MGVSGCAQCVCSVGVMYCVSVHVIVPGASEQPRKRENIDNKSAYILMHRTHSLLLVNQL